MNLETRAAQTIPRRGRDYTCSEARNLAVELAREALAAAAVECERELPTTGCDGSGTRAAAIIRRHAQPSPVEAGKHDATITGEGTTVAPSRQAGDDRGDLRQTADRAPALSDAEVLERAAEIAKRRWPNDGIHLAERLDLRAGELRAAEQPDVFEAFIVEWLGPGRSGEKVAREMVDHARDYYGPLVEALERIRERYGDGTWVGIEVRAALSALRARAGGKA